MPTESERLATLEERARGQENQLKDLRSEFRAGVRELREEIGDLAQQLEEERKARRDGQEARLRESKTNRTLIAVAAIGLFGTFLTSLAAVLAVVV